MLSSDPAGYPLDHGVHCRHNRHPEVVEELDNIFPVIAPEDPVFVLERDDVDIEDVEVVRCLDVRMKIFLRDMKPDPCGVIVSLAGIRYREGEAANVVVRRRNGLTEIVCKGRNPTLPGQIIAEKGDASDGVRTHQRSVGTSHPAVNAYCEAGAAAVGRGKSGGLALRGGSRRLGPLTVNPRQLGYDVRLLAGKVGRLTRVAGEIVKGQGFTVKEQLPSLAPDRELRRLGGEDEPMVDRILAVEEWRQAAALDDLGDVGTDQLEDGRGDVGQADQAALYRTGSPAGAGYSATR